MLEDVRLLEQMEGVQLAVALDQMSHTGDKLIPNGRLQSLFIGLANLRTELCSRTKWQRQFLPTTPEYRITIR